MRPSPGRLQAITLTIVPNAELPPRKLRAGAKLAAGMQFKSDDGQLQVLQLTNAGKWLEGNESQVGRALCAGRDFRSSHARRLSIRSQATSDRCH